MSQSKEVCAENLAHVLRRNHISFPAFVSEIPVKLITFDFPAFSSLIFISILKSSFFLLSSLLFVYWGFFSRRFYQILSGFGELTCSNSVLFDFSLEIDSVFIFFTLKREEHYAGNSFVESRPQEFPCASLLFHALVAWFFFLTEFSWRHALAYVICVVSSSFEFFCLFLCSEKSCSIRYSSMDDT